MSLSWTSSSGPSPGVGLDLGYASDAYSRLSSITAYDNANYLSFTAGVSRTASQASTSVYSNQSQLMGFSQTFGRDTFGRVSCITDYPGSTALRWDRDRLAARGRTSTADRWEYRYNTRGEVASARSYAIQHLYPSGQAPVITP